MTLGAVLALSRAGDGLAQVSTIEVDTSTPEPVDPQATPLQTIVVTGSRIPCADYETASPVFVLTRDDVERSGETSFGDLLAELPMSGPVLNRSFNNGGTGETEINLRGLGSNRVLVLVDGHRWVHGLTSINTAAVDLNTIPISIVDRVEILKDGASAIYGSDAITGVINVITRRDWSAPSSARTRRRTRTARTGSSTTTSRAARSRGARRCCSTSVTSSRPRSRHCRAP